MVSAFNYKNRQRFLLLHKLMKFKSRYEGKHLLLSDEQLAKVYELNLKTAKEKQPLTEQRKENNKH